MKQLLAFGSLKMLGRILDLNSPEEELFFNLLRYFSLFTRGFQFNLYQSDVLANSFKTKKWQKRASGVQAPENKTKKSKENRLTYIKVMLPLPFKKQKQKKVAKIASGVQAPTKLKFKEKSKHVGDFAGLEKGKKEKAKEKDRTRKINDMLDFSGMMLNKIDSESMKNRSISFIEYALKGPF